MSQDPDAFQLGLLRLLNEQPNLSQRELSRVLGLSLGKTHYVLHVLLDKGLVKFQNSGRSNNKLAGAYLLTPSGIAAKSRMTREFLKFKMRQLEKLSREIDALRQETEGDGPAPPWVPPTPSATRPPSDPGAQLQVPIARQDHR